MKSLAKFALKNQIFGAISCFTFIFLNSSAFANESSALSSQQISTIRMAVQNSSKLDCTNFWTANSDAQNGLYKIGSSVSEQCKCVVDEMDFLMSDDEKISVFFAFSIFGRTDSKNSEIDSANATLNAWLKKNRSVINSCFVKISHNSRKDK